jgi:hypothetical protein
VTAQEWEEALAAREQFADLRMVEMGRGTGPSLDLDPSWDEITKLRWKAALVERATGIRVIVTRGHGTINGREIPNQYNLNIGSSSLSGASFNSNWTLLNGVEIGFEEAARVRS